ncbi:chemotaxis protein CheW [Methylobacterium sp. J-076]|uniref:chemotaxis protein CheW n=1 Tax=Methylobacterium sp. J-076 TaxID=2836655 RepID=UPI001FBB02DB|nr:chemotaxis protein CheW [Methylobacterium sp. J-076]MCJ2013285.1 chemotaxis protein CheW [Methylobacterium sp. J-076]
MRDATQPAALRDDARDREIRAARTLALARRTDAAAGPARPTYPYLVCTCGGERIGLPLPAVAQVLPGRPCTPVPGAAAAVSGIVALSGRIVPVIGLARALGRPEGAGAGEHLVLLRGEPPVALCVERALTIVRSVQAPAAAEAAPLGNGSASDYVPGADGSPDFTIIDPAQVLRRVMP